MCVLRELLRRRTRLVPFRGSISFWSCHGCRAGYGAQLFVRCLCEDPTMWTRWQGGFHTTMKKQANPLYAEQRWLSSVKAACLLVVESHHPYLPSKIFSGGPSPCKGRMSSGRCVGRNTQPRQGTRHYDV
ncbi:hypothetical protein TcCL_NonESM10726 [Trypanosoma cruzi]|nr:hypothetical protein TcCL_NonESM10726 [Trypanosoma cruzi]